MDIVLVGIGGALGTLTRYKLGKVIAQKHNSDYPIGTFLINISGAILLGILTGLNLKHSLSLLLADGFLGAYTTFSTFMYEDFHLFHENDRKNAVLYMLGTLAFGLVGFFIGFEMGKMIQS